MRGAAVRCWRGQVLQPSGLTPKLPRNGFARSIFTFEGEAASPKHEQPPPGAIFYLRSDSPLARDVNSASWLKSAERAAQSGQSFHLPAGLAGSPLGHYVNVSSRLFSPPPVLPSYAIPSAYIYCTTHTAPTGLRRGGGEGKGKRGTEFNSSLVLPLLLPSRKHPLAALRKALSSDWSWATANHCKGWHEDCTLWGVYSIDLLTQIPLQWRRRRQQQERH